MAKLQYLRSAHALLRRGLTALAKTCCCDNNQPGGGTDWCNLPAMPTSVYAQIQDIQLLIGEVHCDGCGTSGGTNTCAKLSGSSAFARSLCLDMVTNGEVIGGYTTWVYRKFLDDSGWNLKYYIADPFAPDTITTLLDEYTTIEVVLTVKYTAGSPNQRLYNFQVILRPPVLPAGGGPGEVVLFTQDAIYCCRTTDLGFSNFYTAIYPEFPGTICYSSGRPATNGPINGGGCARVTIGCDNDPAPEAPVCACPEDASTTCGSSIKMRIASDSSDPVGIAIAGDYCLLWDGTKYIDTGTIGGQSYTFTVECSTLQPGLWTATFTLSPNVPIVWYAVGLSTGCPALTGWGNCNPAEPSLSRIVGTCDDNCSTCCDLYSFEPSGESAGFGRSTGAGAIGDSPSDCEWWRLDFDNGNVPNKSLGRLYKDVDGKWKVDDMALGGWTGESNATGLDCPPPDPADWTFSGATIGTIITSGCA